MRGDDSFSKLCVAAAAMLSISEEEEEEVMLILLNDLFLPLPSLEDLRSSSPNMEDNQRLRLPTTERIQLNGWYLLLEQYRLRMQKKHF